MLYKFSIRLYGINCPEKYSRIDSEKEVAQLATSFLTELILNKLVTLNIIGPDKYGRLLANVYIDNISCSDIMLKNRYAVEYDGKKKLIPANWKHYHEHGTSYILH